MRRPYTGMFNRRETPNQIGGHTPEHGYSPCKSSRGEACLARTNASPTAKEFRSIDPAQADGGQRGNEYHQN